VTSMDYFHQMYARSSDPWHLTERPYERRKYELTVASLPARRFARAYEPGCSVGVLTEMLAARCDVLVASDPVEKAVELTRGRAPGVTTMLGALPACWPDGPLDLVVFSEVLYFLDAADRAASIDGARRALVPGGVLACVHWRHPFAEADCDGDQVQREVDAAPGFVERVRHVERDFVLVVLERGASDD